MYVVSQDYLDACRRHHDECKRTGEWEAPMFLVVERDPLTGETRSRIESDPPEPTE